MTSHSFRLIFSLLLVVAAPCRAMGVSADLNGDGAVDGADLDRMRAAFMTDDAAADLNGDGIVDFADLAMLRSMTPGMSSGATAGAGELPVISISPASGTYNVGDFIETLVSVDFSVDPTVGGTFDILYDDAVLAVASIEELPLGDPGFNAPPTLTPGAIVGRGFGDFNGFTVGDALRVTYEVIGSPGGPTPTTALTMRDGTGGGGAFFSAITFNQQTVDYQGAEYDLPSAPRYDYVGLIATCSADCDGYVSLGGPGAANPTPSSLTGFVVIDVAPGESFTTTDITGFRLELGNNAESGNTGGDPSLANPYVIDATQATISGSGSIGADGVLNTGQLTLTLLAEPWLSDQAVLELNVDALQFTITFDAGATAVATGEGGFVGQVLAARILVTPPALDFGTVEVGSIVGLDTVIQNLGLEDLTVGTIGDGDPLSPPFGFEGGGCSGGTLAPGDTCSQSVSFAPETRGLFAGSFDVPSSDSTNPLVTVNVAGQGIGIPDIAVSLPGINFGETPVGTPVDVVVIISNLGTGDLVLGVVGADDPLDDPFAVTADNCSGQTLVPAGTCTFTVEFAPQGAGDYADSFSVSSNDPDQPSLLIDVAGRTGLPNIVVAPVLTTFGEVAIGASSSASIAIVNDGADVLVLGTVGADDPLDAPFVLTSDGCSGQTLAFTDTCTLDVQFAPTVGGRFLDMFSVASNDPDEPLVSLTVAGRTPPQAVVLSIAGADGGVAQCRNLRTGNEARKVLFGGTDIDCLAAGLVYAPGDPLRATIVAEVDDSGGPVTGSIDGLSPTVAACLNAASGENVVIPLAGSITDWDCTATGLVTAPGDKIVVKVIGASN